MSPIYAIYGGTVGSVFYNTGPTALIAKNNIYDSIAGLPNACAAIAIGKNSNYNGSQFGDVGLQLRCNDFSRNPYAISIVDGNLRKYQGEQGASQGNQLAGNAFDHFSSETERDFYVDQVIASSLQIGTYYYYNHSDSTHKVKYRTTSRVDTITVAAFYQEDHCNGGSGNGGIGMGMLSGGFEQIETLDNEITLEEYDLAEAIDNGNSLQLMGMAETMNATNSTAVAEAIGEAGGLISDEVARAYMGNDAGNPFAKAGALLENSPLPLAVQGEIDNMDMNPALLQIIKQNQTGLNVRDSIECVIAQKKQARSLSLKDVVNYAMVNDTLPEEKAAVVKFLEADDNTESKWALFDMYRLDRDYANARRMLGVIGEMNDCTDLDFSTETEDFINLQNVLLGVEAGVLSAEDEVKENEALIVSIAHTETYYGQVTAQLLLSEAGIEPYYEVIRLPEPIIENKSLKFNNQQNSAPEIYTYNDIINVYPNPSSGELFVEYALFGFTGNEFISIFNETGSLIYRFSLDSPIGFLKYSNKLEPGIYIVRLGENFTKKILVE